MATCRICSRDGVYPSANGDDLCEDCIEIGIERARQRREWIEYHPGEPVPECELMPWPTKRRR